MFGVVSLGCLTSAVAASCDCSLPDNCYHSQWAVPCSQASDESACEASDGQWCPTPTPTPPPTPAPTPASLFKCTDNQCLADTTGVSLEVCQSVCGSSKYKCTDNQCLADPNGVSLEICEAVCGSPTPLPTPQPVPPPAPPPAVCVKHEVLTCINDYSSYWPKCDPSQSKKNRGPSGYEFGFYCTEQWADALNSMLSAVGKCDDAVAIKKLLGETTYETGYFSTVYQPADGGAGLIHMIPANWQLNAADMDKLFGNQGFADKAKVMGKSFFQSSQYGWLSVAAWYKRTNRVAADDCGVDLFDAPYDKQTECILGSRMDRSETLKVATDCFSKFMVTTNKTAVV